MSEKKKIVLVDDEPDVLEFMRYNLEREGYLVETATNGLQGIEVAKKHLPDLIILDVMMPELDGIETCKELRKLAPFKNTLIAFLTARSEDYSQIAGLDSGADDYITKPIKPRLLLSRIQALLRRKTEIVNEAEKPITVGNFTVDREKYIVLKDGEEMLLPRKEFELFSLLISKPDRVFTRDQIMEKVWGTESIVGDRTIDVHIRKLREKFGDNYIRTVKGVGYTFSISD